MNEDVTGDLMTNMIVNPSVCHILKGVPIAQNLVTWYLIVGCASCSPRGD